MFFRASSGLLEDSVSPFSALVGIKVHGLRSKGEATRVTSVVQTVPRTGEKITLIRRPKVPRRRVVLLAQKIACKPSTFAPESV